MSELKIELPKQVQKATKVVPSSLILFGLPKSGKTTALAELPNVLFIDVERGSDFIDTMRLQPPLDLGPVGLYNWFKKVCQEIKDAGRPYDYVVIDTVSYLDEKSEWIGTWNYMNSVQGKKFNRNDAGKMLEPDSVDYNSVHNIPDGNGYRFSRKVMTDIFDMSKDLGKVCTIYVCHVKDKFVMSKLTNTEVRSMDLSLTGQVKNIYARDVDAIGYLYHKGGEVFISFKGNEDKIGGMRGNAHIQGFEGKLDWKQIFKLDNK